MATKDKQERLMISITYIGTTAAILYFMKRRGMVFLFGVIALNLISSFAVAETQCEVDLHKKIKLSREKNEIYFRTEALSQFRGAKTEALDLIESNQTFYQKLFSNPDIKKVYRFLSQNCFDVNNQYVLFKDIQLARQCSNESRFFEEFMLKARVNQGLLPKPLEEKAEFMKNEISYFNSTCEHPKKIHEKVPCFETEVNSYFKIESQDGGPTATVEKTVSFFTYLLEDDTVSTKVKIHTRRVSNDKVKENDKKISYDKFNAGKNLLALSEKEYVKIYSELSKKNTPKAEGFLFGMARVVCPADGQQPNTTIPNTRSHTHRRQGRIQ